MLTRMRENRSQKGQPIWASNQMCHAVSAQMCHPPAVGSVLEQYSSMKQIIAVGPPSILSVAGRAASKILLPLSPKRARRPASRASVSQESAGAQRTATHRNPYSLFRPFRDKYRRSPAPVNLTPRAIRSDEYMGTVISMFAPFPSTCIPELRRQAWGRLFGLGIRATAPRLV